MYVRAKVVNGKAYHQVVEGVRIGPRVRQRVVVALGDTPDPAVALANMKRELTALRGRSGSDRRRERLRSRIEELAHILDAGLIGAAPRRCTMSTRRRAIHEAGHAVVCFEQGRSIKHVTINPGGEAGEESAGHVRPGKGCEMRMFPSGRRLFGDLEFLCAGCAAEAIDRREEGTLFWGKDLSDVERLLSGYKPSGEQLATYIRIGIQQARTSSSGPKSGHRSRRWRGG